MSAESKNSSFVLEPPTVEDAAEVAALIGACHPLEPNTTYAYLLFCTHFADTCIVARDEEGIAGVVIGYRPPTSPDCLFVWQIAVAERTRGAGLGREMLNTLLDRQVAKGCRYLQATVAPSNTASHRLFTRFAERRGVACERIPHFEEDHFGSGDHEAEYLYHIGPFG